jgi:hypothetical protein
MDGRPDLGCEICLEASDSNSNTTHGKARKEASVLTDSTYVLVKESPTMMNQG